MHYPAVVKLRAAARDLSEFTVSYVNLNGEKPSV